MSEELRGNETMEKFLGSVGQSTSNNYRRGLILFMEWYGKDIETILKERQDDLTPKPSETLVQTRQRGDRYEKLIEQYHKWLITKTEQREPYNINTARTYCLGILQIFRYYNMEIHLRSQSPVNQTVLTIGDFVFTPQIVRAMFHVAKDLRSKLIVSMGNDLAWRIGDTLSIQKTELPSLDQPTPIEWTRITEKEKQVSKTCLSETTVLLLKEYLEVTKHSKNPYLFASNGEGHIDDKTVNDRLRDLARESGIVIGNMKLTWHCFRDMVISQGKNLGIDPDIVKLMVGKAINKSMLPYLTGIDVKGAFEKLQSITAINGTIIKEQSKDVITGLQKQIEGLITEIRVLTVAENENRVKIDTLKIELEERGLLKPEYMSYDAKGPKKEPRPKKGTVET